jgi:hypothetical protein
MEFLNNISSKAGSAVNKKLGGMIKGYMDKDGIAMPDIPTYDDFLYNILSDVNNAVTESSYWIVFFSRTPTYKKPGGKLSFKSMIKNAVTDHINSSFGIKLGASRSRKVRDPSNLEVHPWVTSEKTHNAMMNFFNKVEDTIMLVQGIEIPGDGFKVTRRGADNIGGFLRPPLTGMRDDPPEMEITFLENNSSVTDLVLRPWVIESSYKSLKFANKAVITCHNLTRSPSGWRVRKTFTFYNAVPISIDAEKYDYSGATSFGKRQCKFTFTDYSIDDGNSMEDGFLESLANYAMQKTKNFISATVESGVDVLAGGANQVVTNIKGAFVDTMNDHLQDIQSRVREFGEDAESSIIDKSKRLIDKSIGFHGDKDSIMRGGGPLSTEGVDNNPSPRIHVDSSPDDAMASPPIPPRSLGVANESNYNLIGINGDDTVNTGSLNSNEVTINGDDTVNTGSLNSNEVAINDVNVELNVNHVQIPDDTVDTKSLNLDEVVINNIEGVLNTNHVETQNDDNIRR